MKRALLIVDHGSKRQAANDMIFDVVAKVAEKNTSIIIEGAHMELASPTIEDGIKACINKGAEHITVQPFMLSPGRHSTTDIPNLVQESAKKHPNVTINVNSHFGLHQNIINLLADCI